jgi:hypothetical protein
LFTARYLDLLLEWIARALAAAGASNMMSAVSRMARP